MQLDEYLVELNKVQLLSPEEERALWHDYKIYGQQAARKRIIEAYQPLVFKVAAPFRGLDNVMDVLQEGTVGLIEAVENYDPERGVAFSLFAMYRIRGRMHNFLKQEGHADVACLEDRGPASVSGLELLVDTGATVAEQVELQMVSSQVQQVMDRLPDKEQLVLNQIYLQSQEAKEVAAMMNVSTSHIYRLQKSGVRRARGMLSRFMQHWK